MALHLHDLMEPEETVGNLWHDYAQGIGAGPKHIDQIAMLAQLRPSLAVLFRALGGSAGAELIEAPAIHSPHRRDVKRRLGTDREVQAIAGYDGERLRLPPEISYFDSYALNRAAYFWLTALAAVTHVDMPAQGDAYMADRACVRLNFDGVELVLQACPGLRKPYALICSQLLETRKTPTLPEAEGRIESAILSQLRGS